MFLYFKFQLVLHTHISIIMFQFHKYIKQDYESPSQFPSQLLSINNPELSKQKTAAECLQECGARKKRTFTDP